MTVLVMAASAGSTGIAAAHPLGNFTTNTALQLTVLPHTITARYVVDLAEIPALQVRQSLDSATSDVLPSVAQRWSVTECATRAQGISLSVDGASVAMHVVSSSATFPAGQAGLSTARLTCDLQAPSLPDGAKSIEVDDTNFADRLGWRETTAIAAGGAAIQTDLPSVSPSQFLTTYPSNGATAGLNVRGGVVRVVASSDTNPAVLKPSGNKPSERVTGNGNLDRGTTGFTKRFQDLVARDDLSPLFTIGALLLAMVLGGFHAMAPGHGKSMMAAYVLSRRGGRRELVTIGGTVAITHTVGVLILGGLFLAGNSVSAGKTVQWTEIASGVLVIAVGAGLLRERMRAYRSGTGLLARSPLTEPSHRVALLETSGRLRDGSDPHPHDHSGHDHPHPHDHSGHDHPHPHDHTEHHDHTQYHDHTQARGTRHRSWRQLTRGRNARIAKARQDPNLVVTSHAHGGLEHTHVLPAPGALVSRRQLLSMGLAGGLVPSPSALVVLLGAVALGRAWFGILLVVAYGIGLALTLMGAGMLLAFFETRIRNWSTRTGRGAVVVGPAIAILPLVSAFALVGAGTLLVARALAM